MGKDGMKEAKFAVKTSSTQNMDVRPLCLLVQYLLQGEDTFSALPDPLLLTYDAVY